MINSCDTQQLRDFYPIDKMAKGIKMGMCPDIKSSIVLRPSLYKICSDTVLNKLELILAPDWFYGKLSMLGLSGIRKLDHKCILHIS